MSWSGWEEPAGHGGGLFWWEPGPGPSGESKRSDPSVEEPCAVQREGARSAGRQGATGDRVEVVRSVAAWQLGSVFLKFSLFFWLRWVLVAARGVFVVACRLLSSCGMRVFSL